MVKKLMVPKHLYEEVKELKKGEGVRVFLHLHCPTYGTCEVSWGGARPISCKISARENISHKRSHRTAVFLTRK